MKSLVKIFALALAFLTTGNLLAQSQMVKNDMHHAEPTVIKLSQTDGKYLTSSLDLKAGTYIFEITNEDVDHPVAFFLTTSSDTETPLENSMLDGAVSQGNSLRSGVVHLSPGNYNYSCPLNPTPKYNLTVKQ